jgi:hypothetical protein
VTASTEIAAPPPPGGPPTPPQKSKLGRVLVIIAIVGMVGMWVYVLYLAFGPGRAEPPDHLADRTFPTAAQATCSAALDRVAALPPAHDSKTPVDRALVINQADGYLRDMLDQLDRIVPAGDDGRITKEWLTDWRTYLSDREDFATALRHDPKARLLVSPKKGDQITEYLDAFAGDNNMPACSTPGDVG